MRTSAAHILFTILLLSYTDSFTQETQRWQGVSATYPHLEIRAKKAIDFTLNDPESLPVDVFIFLYRNLLSEHDGDNCPFHPSCSAFLLQAVKREGLFTGGFMFWDRFTRDVNVFNRKEKYGIHSSGRFYDPPFYYSSKRNIINYRIQGDE